MTAELDLSDAPVLSLANAGIAFAPAVTPDTYQESSSRLPSLDYPLLEPEMFPVDFEDLEPRQSGSNRRKTSNHIPRPPNAFILFRSAFIKSQRVTSGVESSHSTLSKIIGLTWQQLSNEERQKWHAKAKLAQEEHKRRHPQYSFKPIHHRLKGANLGRRKLREVGPKDQQRCEKIAELLASGKKGHELEEAIKEFDKHHVPQIVTRFEEPITASSFSNSSRGSSPFSTYSRRSTTPSSQGRPTTSRSAIPTPPPIQQPEHAVDPIASALSFDSNAHFPDAVHSFDIDKILFSVQPSTPPIIPENNLAPVIVGDSLEGYGHIGRSEPNFFRFAHIDEWAPRSPISPNSLPTTPANQTTNVSFPDPNDALYDQPVPLSFPPDSIPGKYHNVDCCGRHFPSYPSYTDYTQYHDHAYSLQVPVQQPTTKRAGGGGSRILAGDSIAGSNTTTREDLDFSMLMASFDPSYTI